MGGLIGSDIAGAKAGKTADLFFNVVAYTQEGKKTTIAFRFVNPKPANQPKMELPMFTGLAMGKTRWLDELRAALAAPTGQTGNPSLPDQINGQNPAASTMTRQTTPSGSAEPLSNTARAAALPEQLLNQLATPVPSLDREQQWQAYLKSHGLEPWAIRTLSWPTRCVRSFFRGRRGLMKICSAVWLVLFMVMTRAQSGQLGTPIHPWPVAGVQIKGSSCAGAIAAK